MNSLLFLSIFSVLGIVYFLVGLYASKGISTNKDYFLAGRNLGLGAVTFTLIATQLGGNLMLGAAQWAYDYGVYGILYALGMSVGFLLLACGVASRLRACNVATTAELFETKYKSAALKKVASLLSILSLSGILISIVLSSKALIQGVGIENELIFIAFWAFIIIYTMFGGLQAVVLTDKYQVAFIILSFGGIFLYSLWALPEGLLSFGQLAQQQSTFSLAALTPAKMLAAFLMPALFSLIEQDLAQCFFAARNKRIAFMSALFAGLFIVAFGFIPVYFGMQAQLLGIQSVGSPLIAMLQTITSEFVFVLAICGIIAAITSTADTLLCAISSNISQDFQLPFETKNNRLFISQAITFIVGILVVVASYTVPQNIIGMTIQSYELSVCCLLVPLVFAYFSDNVKKNAAIYSIALGLFGFVAFRIYPVPFSEIITLGMSLAGYMIGNRK